MFPPSSTTLFPTITATHWRDAMRRSKVEPNAILTTLSTMRISLPRVIGRNINPRITPGGFSHRFQKSRAEREREAASRVTAAEAKEVKEAANRIIEGRAEVGL